MKNQLTQQKSKSYKESNKNKELISKLEKDMMSLKKGMSNAEKEKSQLKEDYKRRIELEYKSNGDTKAKRRLNSSNELTKSGDCSYLFSRRMTSKPSAKPLNSTFFKHEDSKLARKDNPLFSSTNSLKSFRMLQSSKNLAKK